MINNVSDISLTLDAVSLKTVHFRVVRLKVFVVGRHLFKSPLLPGVMDHK